MKRELIQNIKVIPYKSGDAIDRERFLSGVLAVSLGAATGEPTGITVKIAVTECDTQAGGYTACLLYTSGGDGGSKVRIVHQCEADGQRGYDETRPRLHRRTESHV